MLGISKMYTKGKLCIRYHRSWPLSFLHLPSIPSSPRLLSISRASWHIPLRSQQWWQDHLHIGPPREHQPKTHVTRPPAQWWRARDWVGIPDGPRPSPQTLPTRTRLRALAYIPWTNRTIHSSTPSFLRAHQITFRGTRSNALSRSTKAI